MRISLICLALALLSCQFKSSDEQASKKSNKVNPSDSIPETGEEVDLDKMNSESGRLSDISNWEFVKRAFPEITSFPITGDVFPLKSIVIDQDTIMENGQECYYFPKEIMKKFVANHISPSDSLGLWFENRESLIGEGTDFEFGVYPHGKFSHHGKNYFIYYVLDDLTGRGSYELLFYLAKEANQQWESTYIGTNSFYKYNKTKWVKGEEVFVGRMAIEDNFKMDLEGDKLMITHYNCEHSLDEEFDMYVDSNKTKETEIILE